MKTDHIEMPATVEDAVRLLQGAETLAAGAAEIVSVRRQHLETLTQQRRTTIRVVGGTDVARRARA